MAVEVEANSLAAAAGAAARRLGGVISQQIPETTFEFVSDAVLAIAFLATAIVAGKR